MGDIASGPAASAMAHSSQQQLTGQPPVGTAGATALTMLNAALQYLENKGRCLEHSILVSRSSC